MAVFYLHHSGLGKAKYDRHGAIAHGGYILRKKALLHAGARHMPTDYRQVLGFLGRIYDESRKNARVYDRLIINLPRELSTAEHVSLLRVYLDAVTQGRAPYLFAIHGDKPGNHHAHVIIRDADVETGKRVAQLSAAGSTYKLRAMWERVANDAIADHRIAISRYGKHSPQQRYHDGQIARVMRLEARTSLTAPECTRVPHAESAVMSIVKREKEPAMSEQQTPELVLVGKTRVHDLLQATSELGQIQLAQDMLAEARRARHEAADRLKQYEDALPRAQDALEVARKQHLKASTSLKPYKHVWGGLKGVAFSVFGWTYKSPVRKRAEAAKGEFDLADARLRLIDSRKTEMLRHISVLEKMQAESEKAEKSMRDMLSTYGSEEDVRAAKAMHISAIERLKADLSPERLDDMLAKQLITPQERAKALEQLQRSAGLSY